MKAEFDQKSQRLTIIWVIVAGLAALTLAILGYRFRGHLSSAFGLLAEETGGKTVAALSLVGALFILVCAFFWMIFPILVFLGLRDLRHRTARLHETTELCVQQLAQLTAQDEALKAEAAPEQKARSTGSVGA